MAKQRTRITLSSVRALQPKQGIWDDSLRGFYARRQVDAVTYGVTYRIKGRQRWYSLGRHGPLTPEMARREATRILGLVAQGRDPAAERDGERKQMTVSELCARYVSDAESGRILRRGKAKKSVKDDAARIRNHVLPLLGQLPANAVTRTDIERFLHGVAEGRTGRTRERSPVPLGGRGAATRSLAMLSAIFAWGCRLGFVADNPCRHVEPFATQRRQRRLSDIEFAKLGAALEPHDGIIRFLCLTGWRSKEARELRWGDCDLPRRIVNLSDTKTGPSLRVLSVAACEVIRAQPRIVGSDLVFPGSKPQGLVHVTSAFQRLRRHAELPRDITPHVLRHSFGSVASDLGFSYPIIASLLGHVVQGVTSGYVHLSDPALQLAADRIAGRITELMHAGVCEAAAAD